MKPLIVSLVLLLDACGVKVVPTPDGGADAGCDAAERNLAELGCDVPERCDELEADLPGLLDLPCLAGAHSCDEADMCSVD